MRLFIDPQVFWWQRFGGVSRYFAELLEDFLKDPGIEVIFPIRTHDNAHLREKGLFPNSAPFEFAQSLQFKGSNRLKWLLFRQREKVLKAMKEEDYDLYVPTFFDPYFLEHKKDVPFLLTVHDMTHEISPDSFPRDTEFVANKRRLIEAADRIIAVSHSTKDDIVRFYPEAEARIDVVHHGHSMDLSKVEPVETPERYILFVGKRWLYKNFDSLLNAFAQISAEFPDVHLLCAGGEPFESSELAKIRELGLDERIQHRKINDRSLAYLYANAACFVFPSANEGFGFPILEAMSCECPVVLPRLSSFPEVAGEAAIYYEDEAGLLASLRTVLSGRADIGGLKRAGLGQAAKFSWERCVAETKAVYRSLC